VNPIKIISGYAQAGTWPSENNSPWSVPGVGAAGPVRLILSFGPTVML
jgi:hypothetical protein